MEKFRVRGCTKSQTYFIVSKGRNDGPLLTIGKGQKGNTPPPPGPKSWNSLLQA